MEPRFFNRKHALACFVIQEDVQTLELLHPTGNLIEFDIVDQVPMIGQ